jgi:hypothetical protein
VAEITFFVALPFDFVDSSVLLVSLLTARALTLRYNVRKGFGR